VNFESRVTEQERCGIAFAVRGVFADIGDDVERVPTGREGVRAGELERLRSVGRFVGSETGASEYACTGCVNDANVGKIRLDLVCPVSADKPARIRVAVLAAVRRQHDDGIAHYRFFAKRKRERAKGLV